MPAAQRQHEPSDAYDLLVIGGGNAALCAALMAREAGASVLLVESAPKAWRGGNSMHVRNLRCMHDAPQDVLIEAYPEEEYWQDLLKVTGGLTVEDVTQQGSRNLSISLRNEVVALCRQLVLELRKVFNNAVVHHGQLAAVHHVWVSVQIRRTAVGGPAGVANAQDRVLERAGLNLRVQRGDLAGLLAPANLAVGIHSNTSGVISAVLQTAQAFQYYVQGNESQTSHSSMFTSLYPAVHNVRLAGQGGTWRIEKKFNVIGTELSAAGLTTLGVTGNGYVNDYPTGRLLRDAKLYEIGAGTSEIRRMLIGRELFAETA